MSDPVPAAVGLCAHCRHARIVRTARSEFWLCERSRHDAGYDRYPRLPKLTCPGHEEGQPAPWKGSAPAADPAGSD